MRRLTHSEVKLFRNAQLKRQGGICPLCELPLDAKDSVLDHCHKTGECRGVIHRGCNALLGKVENNRAMNDMVDREKFERWIANLPGYIENNRMGVLYPTHKTEAEKKNARNKKRRKAYAAKKTQEGETGE